MNQGARQAFVLVLALCAGCGSVGPAQQPINEKPIAFVDARSGAEIDVLLIPKYSSHTGISTGAGHGPGTTLAESQFLAFPAPYRVGQRFRVPQPDSTGVLAGPLLFAGRGITLDGVVVLAPRHQGVWVLELWDRPRDYRVRLEPDATPEAASRRLLTLLDQPRIRGRVLTEAERQIFSIIPDFDLELKFTKDERRTIRDFLTAVR